MRAHNYRGTPTANAECLSLIRTYLTMSLVEIFPMLPSDPSHSTAVGMLRDVPLTYAPGLRPLTYSL